MQWGLRKLLFACSMGLGKLWFVYGTGLGKSKIEKAEIKVSRETFIWNWGHDKRMSK